MTPERMAALVTRWVRRYTRRLPEPIARRRIEEVGADLHDHIAHERADGTGEGRIALGIASRMVRGLAADAAWRGRHAKSSRREARMTTSRPLSRSVAGVVIAAALILLVPLSATLFTGAVAWGVADFAAAGLLLVGIGLAFELTVRRPGDVAFRSALAAALAAVFLLVWINLAVGVIGEPGEPANAMYAGVLAVGIAGAVIARLRPDGMARALLATALAQALAAAIALIAGKHRLPMSSVSEILALNGFFVALFLGSASLFRQAARRRRSAEAAPDA